MTYSTGEWHNQQNVEPMSSEFITPQLTHFMELEIFGNKVESEAGTARVGSAE
jgi:hypothetical protein